MSNEAMNMVVFAIFVLCEVSLAIYFLKRK